MVEAYAFTSQLLKDFQYSLCRVVLMVHWVCGRVRWKKRLSVLALSSRFDGHGCGDGGLVCVGSFSTRSVESF